MTSQLIVRFRERILAGTYAPGSALRQDTLASEFGTSKIPVREALVQLQSEGLIDIFPNRGFHVRPLAASELDEIFSLRLQIEPKAVARGAKLATPADHAAARKALDQLNEALAAGEFSSSGQLNRRFHLLLIVPRLQPVAADILGRLHTLARRYVQLTCALRAASSAQCANMRRCSGSGAWEKRRKHVCSFIRTSNPRATI